jgi:GT2 family glycosyltransferase
MIVRRQQYLQLGGMEDALQTGEDLDYCRRVTALGGRIRYSPNVTVFHRSRDFGLFVLQRAVYGASVWRLTQRGLKWGNIYLFAPGAAVLFLASAPISLIFPTFAALQAVGLILLVAILSWETFRTSKQVSDLPGIFVVLGIGLLMPGLGTLLAGFGLLRDIKAIYSNNRSIRSQ